MPTTLDISQQGSVAVLTLARPEIHNAFDATMIAELRDAFTTLGSDANVRAVVLTGSGASFCAGGDMHWMRQSLDWSHEQNIADAYALAAMFAAAWSLPKPLIGRINGAAMGGGAGLVACCDLAIATDTARFGFSEVKIGLVPAVIAQYVVPKIGISHSRALFVSGERFTAERAFEIGLIHGIADDTTLDATVNGVLAKVLTSGSQAMALSKQIIDAVWTMERDAARSFVTNAIATARTGPEGQEGLRAFLEKRRPNW